jgi:hypothetical protein
MWAPLPVGRHAVIERVLHSASEAICLFFKALLLIVSTSLDRMLGGVQGGSRLCKPLSRSQNWLPRGTLEHSLHFVLDKEALAFGWPMAGNATEHLSNAKTLNIEESHPPSNLLK